MPISEDVPPDPHLLYVSIHLHIMPFLSEQASCEHASLQRICLGQPELPPLVAQDGHVLMAGSISKGAFTHASKDKVGE